MRDNLLKNMATDYNVSISASGGGKFRKSTAKSGKSGIDSDDDYDESSAFPSESATVTQSIDKMAFMKKLTEKYIGGNQNIDESEEDDSDDDSDSDELSESDPKPKGLGRL